MFLRGGVDKEDAMAGEKMRERCGGKWSRELIRRGEKGNREKALRGCCGGWGKKN